MCVGGVLISFTQTNDVGHLFALDGGYQIPKTDIGLREINEKSTHNNNNNQTAERVKTTSNALIHLIF